MFKKIIRRIEKLNSPTKSADDIIRLQALRKKLLWVGGGIMLVSYVGFLICAVFLLLDGFQGLAGAFPLRFWISLALVVPLTVLCIVGKHLSTIGVCIAALLEENNVYEKRNDDSVI